MGPKDGKEKRKKKKRKFGAGASDSLALTAKDVTLVMCHSGPLCGHMCSTCRSS
jgi:hypothetical protein